MKRAAFFLVLVGIAIALIAAFSVLPRAPHAPLPQNEPVVRIGDVVIPVEIANSPDEWNRGLSGRQSLAEERGMLFIFPQPGTYAFWMPDMHFAIDIIWIGQDRRIVDISANVAPESYPERFMPSSPVQYVLEVNAGFAARNNIRIGDTTFLP